MPPKAYDHPDFLITRTKWIGPGTYSMSAAGTAFAGTTLKSYTKFAVLGAQIIIVSGGSVGGTTTIGISRLGASGTASSFQNTAATVSAGASALNTKVDISCSSDCTLASFGTGAVIVGSSKTIADFGCVVSDVIWRYRLLPFVDPT